MLLPILQLTPSAIPTLSDPSDFTKLYEDLFPIWARAVIPLAVEMFLALALLEFGIYGWTLWRRHGVDINAAILGVSHKLIVLGMFLSLLLNGPEWMGLIIDMFTQVGKIGSGVASLQPSVVMASGVSIAFKLLGQSVIAGVTADLLTSIAMLIAATVIIGAFLLITLEFVVTKVQTFLVLGMGMFFLAFGGSGWTRTYVERYFAYAFSSGIRLMTNYFLIGAGLTASAKWLAMAQQAAWSIDGVKQAWLIMIGAVIYAVIVWRGSAIAAQLLGGGPNLTHGDVFHAIGVAASAGAAATIAATTGAAIASAASAGASASSGGAAHSATSSPGTGSTPASRPPSTGATASQVYQSMASLSSAMHGAGSSGQQVHPPVMHGFGGNE